MTGIRNVSSVSDATLCPILGVSVVQGYFFLTIMATSLVDSQ